MKIKIKHLIIIMLIILIYSHQCYFILTQALKHQLHFHLPPLFKVLSTQKMCHFSSFSFLLLLALPPYSPINTVFHQLCSFHLVSSTQQLIAQYSAPQFAAIIPQPLLNSPLPILQASPPHYLQQPQQSSSSSYSLYY